MKTWVVSVQICAALVLDRGIIDIKYSLLQVNRRVKKMRESLDVSFLREVSTPDTDSYGCVASRRMLHGFQRSRDIIASEESYFFEILNYTLSVLNDTRTAVFTHMRISTIS